MKKILFITDFSECAENAFNYAVKLSKDVHAQLLILHVYELKRKAVISTLDVKIREEANTQITVLEDRAQAELGEGATVLSKVLKGDVVTVVEKFTSSFKIDFIVAGTKGDRNHDDEFLGKTAGELLKKVFVPLIFVPMGQAYRPIHKIVMLLKNPRISNQKTIKPLNKLIRNQDTEIVLAHYEKEAVTGDLKAKNMALESSNVHVEKLNQESVLEALAYIENDMNPDLLCVIRRQYGFFTKHLKYKYIKIDTFNTNLPVLVLRGDV